MQPSKDIEPIIQSTRALPGLMSLSAYTELIKSKFNKSVESEYSSSSSMDAMQIPDTSTLKPVNSVCDAFKMATEISSAATITEHLQIPVLNKSEFKEEFLSPKQSQTNRSNPSDPFCSMIKKDDQDFRGLNHQPRPSLQILSEKSQIKREQQHIKHLKDSLELEFQMLEKQKNKLQQEKKEYEDFIVSQRSEIITQMHQIQRKRESLLIRQKILDRNNLLSNRKNKDASKYKLELFCYKLSHALQLPEKIKSLNYHFFHKLASYQRARSNSKEKKKLLKVKSCQRLRLQNPQKKKSQSKNPKKKCKSRSRPQKEVIKPEVKIQNEKKNVSKEKEELRLSNKNIKINSKQKTQKNSSSNLRLSGFKGPLIEIPKVKSPKFRKQ